MSTEAAAPMTPVADPVADAKVLHPRPVFFVFPQDPALCRRGVGRCGDLPPDELVGGCRTSVCVWMGARAQALAERGRAGTDRTR